MQRIRFYSEGAYNSIRPLRKHNDNKAALTGGDVYIKCFSRSCFVVGTVLAHWEYRSPAWINNYRSLSARES